MVSILPRQFLCNVVPQVVVWGRLVVLVVVKGRMVPLAVHPARNLDFLHRYLPGYPPENHENGRPRYMDGH